ncbi:MAG: sugar ABC transporter permease [Alphaproteobacteria bacterium]|nr:sugar ABC transporter permease [Alphaproteobacteria bacterium]
MRGQKRFAWLMATPTIIALIALGIVPLGWMIWTAFQSFPPNPANPPQFIGMRNFVDLADDPQFFGSLRTTAIVLVFSLSLQLVLGFLLALALYSIERGRGLIVSLLLIPTAIAPIVAGIVWWMLFNARFGAINSFLVQFFGIDPVNWTIEMPTALIAIIVAVVWQWTPFVAIILLGGLTTIPRDVLDAARIDGASGWRVLRYIIVPLMRPFFLVVGLLMIIEIVRLYELPFFITQGGPGNETVVAGVYLFKLAFSFFDLGRASMMSVFLVIALSLVAALYMRLVADRRMTVN